MSSPPNSLAGSVPVRLVSSSTPGAEPDLELAAHLYPAESDRRPGGRSPEQSSALSPGLIVAHGAGSRAARHAEFCRAASHQGFVVLAFDFRGHGDSAGIGDGPLELDVLAATRFLRSQPTVDDMRICYRGSSMGGFYGLKAQPEAQFAALALLCPAGEDVILEALEELQDPEQDTSPSVPPETRWDRSRLQKYFGEQDSRLLAELVDCPVLLIHARPDQTVPFTHSLLLARHLHTDTTLVALEHGGHTSAQHDPAVHAFTIAWLLDRIVQHDL